MLSNLETEKSKLLQIVLVGQPNLRDKLGAPELEQLRQRITVSYHLMPLDPDETARYINHRLHRAALGAPLEFPRDVTDLIHARSRGVPRIVNVMCDATLVFGYAEERQQIDFPLMHEVIQELELTGVLPVGGPALPGSAGEPHPAPAGTARAEVQPVGVAPFAAPAAQAAAPFAVAERAAMIDQRTAALDQREQTLAQRERELADQRRVLAEEYRLLRQRSAPAQAAAPATARPQAPPVVRPEYRRPAPQQPQRARRFEPARAESPWGRFKRFWVGAAASTMEN